MTAVKSSRALGLARQLLMVVLINVPTVSLGLAMGWVSLASGEHGTSEKSTEPSEPASEHSSAHVVVAAATTFAASLVGVPLSARALAAGRKFATIATSLMFVVCWALKLASSLYGEASARWWVVAARVAAGLGGAGAYTVPPLLAREMCEERVAGAAVSALVLAHNTGILLMYGAAAAGIDYRTVLWSCLALSLVHCVVFLFVPESPAYLAASGRGDAARSALAWLRGADAHEPALSAELDALPPPDDTSPLDTVKELMSDKWRRRAFMIAAVVVVGQETCGVFTLIQFAERTFVLARDESQKSEHEPGALAAGSLVSPANYALLLGAIQLVASAVALYLVERVGRRRMGLLDKLSLWLGGAAEPASVLVLGLDNSGKSSLLNALRPPERRQAHVAPTVAAQQERFTSGGVTFAAWDVSGAPRHRALWERHYRRADAVIFVVDSADHLRLVVAREELELLLAHPDMFGRRIPLLVLANKCDTPLALAPMQIAAALCLERVVDKPWHISASNALSGAGLPDGVAWLARQLRDARMTRGNAAT